MFGRVLAALTIVAVAGAAAAQEVKVAGPDFGRFHALVIGNNDYLHLPKLTTAIADAEAVAAVLESRYGFRVTRLVNATRRDIADAFNRLRQTLTEADNLVVYYAGHGVLDREAGEGYWQPIDAQPDNDSQWFPNTRLTRYLKAMSARHVMVIADSCYSGNLTRGGTSTLRSAVDRQVWIDRMNARRSRTALTSGGLEPVLDGGGGGHSVFARALLDTLRENTGVLFGQELFDRMKGQVVANADQTPEYSDIRYTGHQKGDFLLVPVAAGAEALAATAGELGRRQDAGAYEALYWRSIMNSADPAMYEAYLRRYPGGRFAEIAELKIRGARKAAAEPQIRTQAPPASQAAAAPAQIASRTAAEIADHRRRYPHDGHYRGRLERTWITDMALNGMCREGDLDVTVRDGVVSGGVNVDFINDKRAKKAGFKLQIEGNVDRDGTPRDVKAQLYFRGLNFLTLFFEGKLTEGTWRDRMNQCGGKYRLTRVGD